MTRSSAQRGTGGRDRRRGARLAGVVAAGCLALTSCAREAADRGQIVWEASCRADSVRAGDAFTLTLRGQWPAAMEPAHLGWKSSPDSLLIANVDSARVSAPADRVGRTYTLMLLAPRAGLCRIPPAALVTARGETLALALGAQVRVGSRLPAGGEAELLPIAPMVALHRFPYLAVGAAALLLGATIVAVLARLRRRRSVAAAEPPAIPPREEFQLAIDALLTRRLAEQGQYRSFAQELSWALRRYLGRRWERPALAETRPEILGWLPETRFCVRDQGQIASWLAETDRIKFAGAIPLSERATELLGEAHEIVGRTEEIFAREAAERAAQELAAAGSGERR
jgi:hypothetical protein